MLWLTSRRYLTMQTSWLTSTRYLTMRTHWLTSRRYLTMQTPWLASIYYLTMQVLLGSKWFAPSHPSGKAKSMAVREMAVGRETWDSGTTPVRGIQNLPWSPSAPLPQNPHSVPFPLSLAPFPSSVLQLGALSCLGKCFKCSKGCGAYLYTR